jgi:hypothetical protein
MNRQMRRAAQKYHRKEVFKSISSGQWGEWEDITLEAIMKIAHMPEKHRLLNFEKNNIYSAQVIQYSDKKLLGIRRHDQSTDIPWSHKQRIKNEIFGHDVQAIEIYPPEGDLIDGANMYWLWIMDKPLSGFELNSALKGVYSI